MIKSLFLGAATFALMACGGAAEDETTKTVLEQMVDAGSMGLVRGAIPTSEMGFPGATCASLNAGEQCTVTHSRIFEGNSTDGFTMWDAFYVDKIGTSADPAPWDQDGGFYCGWSYSVSSELVDTFAETDVLKLSFTVTAVDEGHPAAVCDTAIPVGTESTEWAYRSNQTGSFLFLTANGYTSQGDNVRFSGLAGVKDWGCDFSPDGAPAQWGGCGTASDWGRMEYYDACTWQAGTNAIAGNPTGKGYCPSTHRLVLPGNDLPLADKAAVDSLRPFNEDLVLEDFKAAHPDIFTP